MFLVHSVEKCKHHACINTVWLSHPHRQQTDMETKKSRGALQNVYIEHVLSSIAPFHIQVTARQRARTLKGNKCKYCLSREQYYSHTRLDYVDMNVSSQIKSLKSLLYVARITLPRKFAIQVAERSVLCTSEIY